LLTLLSEVARNYLQVRGDQLRIAIALKNIKAQTQSVELTRARFEAGLSSQLDVVQSEGQLAVTQATVPALERSARQTIHQLSVLLGQEPGALLDELLEMAPLPSGPPEVPVGIPSDLLRRRPDIRQAERLIAAATARIGVATADLFPRFSLTGSLGLQSVKLSDLVASGSTFWSIGPAVQWPIFNAGRIRANIEVQNAREEQALILYEQTVLAALQEVENALTAHYNEQATRNSLIKAVEANSRAFEISNELYARGLVDFLTVLESQRSLYLSEDQLAQSGARVSANLVALFKALGGGWELAP
jgi:NodT family efflux transporter outer membrane factor (OMF) lipoprotein